MYLGMTNVMLMVARRIKGKGANWPKRNITRSVGAEASHARKVTEEPTEEPFC